MRPQAKHKPPHTDVIQSGAETTPAPASAVAHKFGGSSLATAELVRHVAALVRRRSETTQIVVVSAMQGVTDALIGLIEAAAQGSNWHPKWQELRQQHSSAAHELLNDQAAETLTWQARQFDELAAMLNEIAEQHHARDDLVNAISGRGEILCAQLLHAHLVAFGADYSLLDAREVLVVHHQELGATVDWARSAARLAEWRKAHRQNRAIITGYVARDTQGEATVLGRNGSDYSAAIFAALWNVHALHIWTDVDGVLSADPRIEPEAVALAAMSYEEACELAYFGAKVIHPKTITPAIAHRLPIYIRNTFRPDYPGTRIDANGAASGPVKGLTLARDLALLSVEGSGMIGVPGTDERVFAALRRARISVTMISQGSSEHSICCIVAAGQAQVAHAALENEFARELADEQINGIRTEAGIVVLAAVGDRMAGQPGVAARLFTALARVSINVRAIAQGASERNISVAIDARDAVKALRAAHAAFYLSPQTLSLGIIGPGKVGTALLAQIAAAAPRLKREANLDLRLCAVATSRHMWLDSRGIMRDGWREHFTEPRHVSDLDRFTAQLRGAHLPHTMIVDCSASDAIAEHYPTWLAAGIHVITPNKHAGAGPYERYRAIRAATATGTSRFRYEATVGAGLPVIQTLRDLLDTGDELHAVTGILSGTLAWLFNRYDGSMPFSDLVREAHALGYTEPDPREDLRGTDVARKLVILAREAGRDLSLDDVSVQNLVPSALDAGEANEFMGRLEELDELMSHRLAQAQANNNILRHVAHLQHDGSASVSLVELPRDHAFAGVRLSDNIVQFTTKRYHDNPLIVQGPGAGPEVTAASVFGDILRVAGTLGARV